MSSIKQRFTAHLLHRLRASTLQFKMASGIMDSVWTINDLLFVQ
jgi:hypothetical protein